MNEHFVLVYDDYIAFSNFTHISGYNDNEAPIEYLLSTFGLIIPLNDRSLAPFALNGYLFTSRAKETALKSMVTTKAFAKAPSIVITPNSSTYILSMFDDDNEKFVPKYLPNGPGLHWVGTENIELFDTIFSAINLRDNIDDVLSLVFETKPMFMNRAYRIYRISELVTWIASCIEDATMRPFDGEVIIPSFLAKETEVIKLDRDVTAPFGKYKTMGQVEAAVALNLQKKRSELSGSALTTAVQHSGDNDNITLPPYGTPSCDITSFKLELSDDAKLPGGAEPTTSVDDDSSINVIYITPRILQEISKDLNCPIHQNSFKLKLLSFDENARSITVETDTPTDEYGRAARYNGVYDFVVWNFPDMNKLPNTSWIASSLEMKNCNLIINRVSDHIFQLDCIEFGIDLEKTVSKDSQ